MRTRYLDGPNSLNASPMHCMILQTWESAEMWMQYAAEKWKDLYTAEVVTLYAASIQPQR